MKLTKIALSIALGLAVSACSSIKMSQDGSLENAQETYQQYEEIAQQYAINQEWWKGYRDPNLNLLVERALNNNLDLAKSAVAVNRALYNANLLGAELVPTFSGSGSSSAAKGVGSTSNQITTGTSSINHQVGFNLSYTLDLWKRLADSASAVEWEHKATIEDLKKARLAIINGVISSYYQLGYYKDAIAITEKSIKNYEQIARILTNKMQAGLIDSLAVEQAQQAIIASRNSLVNLRTNQKTAEQTLRNLLNLQPNEKIGVKYPSIMSVKLQGVDMNVPVSAISARPDVTASLQRLQSAFKSLTAMEKSWYPSVTLGASLAGSAVKVADVTDNPLGSGVLSFNLPFLDWNRVSNNVKISETGYEAAKLNYQQTITTALNEIDTYYYAYGQSRTNLANVQKQHSHDKKISTYYKNRYEQGVSEFREWIAAMNTERNSELSILNAKFAMLQNENAVYQAMAGKYSR